MTIDEKIDRLLDTLWLVNNDITEIKLQENELHTLDDSTLEKINHIVSETRTRLFDLVSDIVAVQNSRYLQKENEETDQKWVDDNIFNRKG